LQNTVLDRKALINKAKGNIYDIAIIGGGIHGACICREASLKGYKVLLLDSNDYAYGTSSRSSKMVHGGLRYLETGDIKLVFESLGERSRLYAQAPHLVRPMRFLYPVIPNKTRPSYQIKIGLQLYDLLAGLHFQSSSYWSKAFKPHKFILPESEEAKHLKNLGLSFTALYSYSDGQMDDARLTIENILDCLILGATSLNYCKMVSAKFEPSSESHWRITCKDKISGSLLESKARFIINATGSWAPDVHKSIFQEEYYDVVYSRGSHILFNVQWALPGLILPTPVIGRYYFVWPHFSPSGHSTLVGTTDYEVGENDESPIASKDEIDELLSYLKQDLPNSELIRSNMYQTFSGMRILARKPRLLSFFASSKHVSNVSREHYFLERNQYLALIGGKFTSARKTAERIIKRVQKEIPITEGILNSNLTTRNRPLPGGREYTNQTHEKLKAELASFYPTASEEEIIAALARFGSRAELLLNEQSGDLFTAQVKVTILKEQAITVEDILHRRLGISLTPGAGFERLDKVITTLSKLTNRSEKECFSDADSYIKDWNLKNN
jgi:glycerol-3-phosphate dehydrogenase